MKKLFFRVSLSAASILFSVVFIEVALRLMGYTFSLPQMKRNTIGLTAKQEYRILALGESTTAGGSDTWPAYLEQMLNKRGGGKKFTVFNEGIDGTNTAFIVARLAQNIQKYKPDMVITMMGVNDSQSGFIYDESLLADMLLFLRDMRTYKLVQYSVSSIDNRFFRGQDKNTSAALNRVENDLATEGLLKADQGNIDEAIRIENQVIKINPQSHIPYLNLGIIYAGQHKKTDAVTNFVHAVELEPSVIDMAARYIAPMYTDQIDIKSKIEFLVREQSLSVRFIGKIDSTVTQFHYRKLYAKLREQGIRYAAMQYPMLSVESLKDMLQSELGAKDVLYIENKTSFEEAVKKSSYDMLFTDHYGGSFGHTTKEGHILIAENAAEHILKNLSYEQ